MLVVLVTSSGTLGTYQPVASIAIERERIHMLFAVSVIWTGHKTLKAIGLHFSCQSTHQALVEYLGLVVLIPQTTLTVAVEAV